MTGWIKIPELTDITRKAAKAAKAEKAAKAAEAEKAVDEAKAKAEDEETDTMAVVAMATKMVSQVDNTQDRENFILLFVWFIYTPSGRLENGLVFGLWCREKRLMTPSLASSGPWAIGASLTLLLGVFPTTVHIGLVHTHTPFTVLGLLTAFAPIGHFLLVSEGIG